MEKRESCGGSGSGDSEVRKGPWTMEEDLILINYIANHGEGVWNTLAKSAGQILIFKYHEFIINLSIFIIHLCMMCMC